MRLGRELAALGDDGAGGDDGALTDLRAVEDGGAHPYEAMVLDLAPVHDRVVAEDASLANDRGIAGSAWRMQPSCTLVLAPIRMGSVSPRSTAPYQTLDSSPR